MLRKSLAACSIALVGCGHTVPPPHAPIIASIDAPATTPAPRLPTEPCVKVAQVARAAAFARDSGIQVKWTFTDPLLEEVAQESALWKLDTPAHHYGKFLRACRLGGIQAMPDRLLEFRIERDLLAGVEALGASES